MRARLVVAGLAGALLAAAPAHAAWERPERAANPAEPASAPAMAANSRGDAAMAWVRGEGRRRAVVVALRPAGGDWQRPEGISPRGRPAVDPRVAVGPDGRVVVAWREAAGTRLVDGARGRRRQAVYVARLRERASSSSRWAPVVTLSDPRQSVGPPSLAADARGGAVVAWHWGTGTPSSAPGSVSRVQISESRLGDGWSAPRDMPGAPPCERVRRPEVATGAWGHAIVWWGCDLPKGRGTAAAAARRPGEHFGAVRLLSSLAGPGPLSADLAVAGDGTVVAVGADRDGALRWWRGRAGRKGLELRELPVLGGPYRATRLVRPRVAVSPAGDALSAWIGEDGGTRVAPVARGLGVAAPTTLSPARSAGAALRLAVAGDGRGLVAWIGRGTGTVWAATRSPAGTWGPVHRLTRTGGADPGDSPRVVLDDAGGGAAAWTRLGTRGPFVARTDMRETAGAG